MEKVIIKSQICRVRHGFSCLCSPPKNGTISDLYAIFSDGLKLPTAERMCFTDVRVALQLRERINKRPKWLNGWKTEFFWHISECQRTFNQSKHPSSSSQNVYGCGMPEQLCKKTRDHQIFVATASLVLIHLNLIDAKVFETDLPFFSYPWDWSSFLRCWSWSLHLFDITTCFLLCVFSICVVFQRFRESLSKIEFDPSTKREVSGFTHPCSFNIAHLWKVSFPKEFVVQPSFFRVHVQISKANALVILSEFSSFSASAGMYTVKPF